MLGRSKPCKPTSLVCSDAKSSGKDNASLLKLIVSSKSRKILGAHIIAPQAGEMIQLLGIAIKMGATKEDLDRTMAVHPTISEELVNMRTPKRET